MSFTDVSSAASSPNMDSQMSSSTVLFPDMSLFEEEQKEEEYEEVEIISDWALQKIGTLQLRLEEIENIRDLNNNFRSNSFVKQHLAMRLINLANEIFGYDGWSSKIVDCLLSNEHIEKEDEGTYKCSAVYLSTVRIILRDGTFCDGRGKGDSINMPYKHMCHSKAKKHSITDGLKQAIIRFPEILIQYDVDKLQKDIIKSEEALNYFDSLK